MKALSKGKAAEFFKKHQKKEDPEQILNEAEARTIASQVGIAEQQIPDFKWFFDQISKFSLPSQYQKQLNDKKTHIVYYDKKSDTQSEIHPLINTIRTFFYNEYKSNRSTFTFTSKKDKLLPYVQEKMMKNCLSLNSKRREVEKVNLQKDENGDIVLSKMARLKPDMKSLESARSYMLKMLVDKVFTCKQIWGKGKRAKALANIINQKQKGTEDGEDLIEESPEDLETYQSIFTESSKYYEEEYGDFVKIPTHIVQSQAYKRSTPQSVLRYINLLNISKNQIEFYWFARLMDCLSIPHNWSLQLSSNVESYVYEPLKIKFDIHPSYIYVVKQMNKFKDFFSRLKDEQKALYYNDKQMTFYDFFQRSYTVDMYGLVLKEELKIQVSEKSSYDDDLNKIKSMEQNTNDWMIVEAIINADVQPSDYVLIGKICDFWRSKYFPEEQWIPSVSPFGQVTWSSTVNYSSIDNCPYKEDLIKKVQIQSAKIPSLKLQDFKPHIKSHIQIEAQSQTIKPEQDSQATIELINLDAERQRFLKHYISHYDDPQNPAPFNIEDHDLDDYFDQVFLCPFDLDSSELLNSEFIHQDDEGDQTPIWMEKVKARKFSARIKNSIRAGYNFDEIFEQVKNYTLETTQKHQPQKIEQIKEKLRNVKNYKELQSLVKNVTNVDARQQRKRKAWELMNQQAENDNDIFGSEQQDINISEAGVNDSEESSEEAEEEEDSDESQKPQQISESQSEEEVHENVEVIVQEKPVEEEEQIVQRKDYSFLKDFHSNNSYQKIPELENVNEKELQNLIKGKIKNNKKKQKYSKSSIKSNIKHQLKKNNQLLRDSKQLLDIKKNLITTNLKYSTIPYKNNNLITFKNNQNAQQFLKNKDLGQVQKIEGFKNITQYQILENSQFAHRFQSQMDEYEAEEVIEQIKSLEKKEPVEESIEIKEEQNPQTQVKPVKKEEVKIVLEPIKRTKPDILQDQRLRYVKDLDVESQLNTLRSIFLKKTQSLSDSPIKLRMKSKSISNISKALQSTQNSSLQKSNSLLKSTHKQHQMNGDYESVKNRSKKLVEDKLLPQITSSIFNRVCLDHTASKFLASQSIKRTSELLVLQARKTLVQKGRGLDTYVSKKY